MSLDDASAPGPGQAPEALSLNDILSAVADEPDAAEAEAVAPEPAPAVVAEPATTPVPEAHPPAEQQPDVQALVKAELERRQLEAQLAQYQQRLAAYEQLRTAQDPDELEAVANQLGLSLPELIVRTSQKADPTRRLEQQLAQLQERLETAERERHGYVMESQIERLGKAEPDRWELLQLEPNWTQAVRSYVDSKAQRGERVSLGQAMDDLETYIVDEAKRYDALRSRAKKLQKAAPTPAPAPGPGPSGPITPQSSGPASDSIEDLLQWAARTME